MYFVFLYICIQLIEYVILPAAQTLKSPLCYGVIPRYGVSPRCGVSPCYGVSPLYGVSPCYGVMVLVRQRPPARLLFFVYLDTSILILRRTLHSCTLSLYCDPPSLLLPHNSLELGSSSSHWAPRKGLKPFQQEARASSFHSEELEKGLKEGFPLATGVG